VPVVLEEDYQRANAAQKQTDRHRPEDHGDFASLLPGGLIPEKKLPQQEKRRMFWFDSINISPNAAKSMT